MSQGVQIPQISNVSQLSQASNRQQIRQNINPIAPLIPLNAPAQNSRYLPVLKKILTIVSGIILLALSIWALVYFLSVQNFKSRIPQSVASQAFATKKQAIAPGQSDYVSFIYYRQMQALARKLNIQGRQPTKDDMKQYKGITFKQLYDIFKVARSVQLAKQYSQSQQSQKFNYSPAQGLDIDQPKNFKQYFPQVVNQFMCASCYSFPITATIQFLYKYKYNITIKLSQQQLIDCVNDDPQINGCDDGNITKGFEYVRDVGLISEQQYPYQSIQGQSFKCKKQLIENKDVKKYKISDFKVLPPGNCQSIKQQLVNNNTVASMIDAHDLNKFKINQTFSDCSRSRLNHAITIVGQTSKNEWIVRNSWGPNWGDGGYFLMGRGNSCGVCSHSIVPVLVIQNDKVLSATQIKEEHNSE